MDKSLKFKTFLLKKFKELKNVENYISFGKT